MSRRSVASRWTAARLVRLNDTRLVDVYAHDSTSGRASHMRRGPARPARDVEHMARGIDTKQALETAVLFRGRPGELPDVLTERRQPAEAGQIVRGRSVGPVEEPGVGGCVTMRGHMLSVIMGL